MKLFFVDVETTGLDPRRHGIHQIAGILKCPPRPVRFDYRVRPFPRDEIDESALEVSGIRREELASYPDPATVYQRLRGLLDQRVDRYNPRDKFFFVGYNTRFDYEFLRRFWEKNGDKYFGSYFWAPPLDLMTIAAFVLGAKRAELPDFKLPTVAKAIGLPLTKAHDAAQDVKAAVALYDWLAKQLRG